MSPFSNRLMGEKSPYLLQHAHNPVDWFPWGQEAFALAKAQDKPIFLSIGYASCHWCHVMNKESFSNSEIGRMMNEAFVSIKIDREELPGVDSLYMEFAQALMSSAGGWPLNLILTPELKPFFAVTYLPPTASRGLIGMPQFIQHIQQLWQGAERSELIAQAEHIVDLYERSRQTAGDLLPSETQIQEALTLLFELIDPVYGGFKGEPKFPLGYQAGFLLNHAHLHHDSRSLFCVELSLDKMLQGGIYDQLGGGFSRYAVDERWIVPHFEKMLYDNALLARMYLDAWKVTKKKEYARCVKETLGYLLTEMCDVNGGFYSAEDADSDGHEGLYYTWTLEEIKTVLSPEESALFCSSYGVTEEGNFEHRNVLYLPRSFAECAESHGAQWESMRATLDQARAKLLKARAARVRPGKDDKVICSWNGLMIDVLIRSADSLEQPLYREAALKCAAFIETHLYQDGHLFRRFREQEARFSGGLEDYACVIKGFLSLFEEGHGSHFLKVAIDLSRVLEREFKIAGGSFYSTIEGSDLLMRTCEYYDGAEPSGNALHCDNLLRLYQITQERSYLTQVEDILKAAKQYIDSYPPGACYHLHCLQRYYDIKAPTVVIALDEKKSLEQEIRAQLASQFSPHRCVIWKPIDDPHLTELIPSLVDKNPLDGQTAIYLCRQDHCEPPLMRLSEGVLG